MSNQSSIIEKIEKLLRLSKSPEQGEAENAMAQAIKLATKHNIDINTINPDKTVRFKKVVWDGDIARLPIAQKFISPILRKLLGIKTMYWGNRNQGKQIHFVGTEDNAEMAMRMNNFLNHVFLELWRAYKAKTGCNLKCRDSYFQGLADGFYNKMKSAQNETIAELPAAQQQSYGLVLVSQKQQVEKFYLECYKGEKITMIYHKTKTDKGSNVYYDGVEKGKTIQFHSGALT